jgi:hypothetical protein
MISALRKDLITSFQLNIQRINPLWADSLFGVQASALYYKITDELLIRSSGVSLLTTAD